MQVVDAIIGIGALLIYGVVLFFGLYFPIFAIRVMRREDRMNGGPWMGP